MSDTCSSRRPFIDGCTGIFGFIVYYNTITHLPSPGSRELRGKPCFHLGSLIQCPMNMFLSAHLLKDNEYLASCLEATQRTLDLLTHLWGYLVRPLKGYNNVIQYNIYIYIIYTYLVLPTPTHSPTSCVAAYTYRYTWTAQYIRHTS